MNILLYSLDHPVSPVELFLTQRYDFEIISTIQVSLSFSNLSLSSSFSFSNLSLSNSLSFSNLSFSNSLSFFNLILSNSLSFSRSSVSFALSALSLTNLSLTSSLSFSRFSLSLSLCLLLSFYSHHKLLFLKLQSFRGPFGFILWFRSRITQCLGFYTP